jgi:chromosomal replication initiator protein
MKFYRYFRDEPPEGTERLKSNDIILRVCDYFGHPIEFVMERTRKQEYVKTRYVIAYLLAQDFYLNMSLTSIAFSIGKRDHTTIIHGLKVMENELELYEEFRELVKDVFVYVYGSDSYFPQRYKKLIKVKEVPE